MPVYGPGQKEAIDALKQQIDVAKADLDRKAEPLAQQQRQWEKELLVRYLNGDLAWQVQIPVEVSASSAILTVQKEPIEEDPRTSSTSRSMGVGMISVNGPNPDNETYNVTVRPGAGKWASLGIETGTDESLLGANLARGSERFIVTEVDAEMAGAKLPFLFAYSNVAPISGLSAMAAIDGDRKTGWGIVGSARSPLLMLRFEHPVTTDAESTIVVHIHQDSNYRRATIGRFRVALASSADAWPGVGREDRAESGRGQSRARCCHCPGESRTSRARLPRTYRSPTRRW